MSDRPARSRVLAAFPGMGAVIETLRRDAAKRDE